MTRALPPPPSLVANSPQRCIYNALALRQGSLGNWGAPFSFGECDAVTTKFIELRAKEPCAYTFIHELANLSVAADELLQTGDYHWVYWFGSDDAGEPGGIDIAEGSSLRDTRGLLTMGVFQDNEDYGRGRFVGTGVEPCSDEHFEFLLSRTGGMEPLCRVFGDAACDLLGLDPLSRIRADWPLTCGRMRAIDRELSAPAPAAAAAAAAAPPPEE